jgi:hypothetical protein
MVSTAGGRERVVVAVLAWCATGIGGVGRAQELTLELPRAAYYRGETVPLVVRVPEAIKAGKVTLSLGDRVVSTAEVHGAATQVPLATADFRVGSYALQAVVTSAAGESTASIPVTLARRPPADRLEVWLWCYGGGAGDFGYYYDHGFTIAGGANAVRWEDSQRAAVIASLDARLARGVYSTVIACGGIQRSDLKGVDASIDDVAYIGAGRHDERFFNPWHPAVEKARAELNDRFFQALGDHPAVKVAFFNTELVDDLWLDNRNRAGVEQTRQKLGFTREEKGAATYLMPGVIADDARLYRHQQYAYQEGNGLAYANRRTAEDVKRQRPDVLTLTDPYRSVAYRGLFPGLDLVGTWTYTNNYPKLMLYIETLRALTRGTAQQPLQTVTLLNYPGTLAPRSVTGESSTSQWFASNPQHAGWVLMGPDRCREVSWIILSRAPKHIGYYFSSACDPQKYSAPEDQFRVPHATSEAIRELSERVFQPYGGLLSRLEVARRRIAVLSSQASRSHGSGHTIGYPNEQIYGFYSLLAMNHLDGDVLFDEQVAQGALKDYHVLFMPYCEAITKSMFDEIRAFQTRGGLVVADAFLGADLPGALKADFDFSYRKKVNADAIATGEMFAAWDDQLNPKTAELAKAKGVTAADDQRIMESYARRLKELLAGNVEPAVALDTPQALVNVLEKQGVTYLVLVNDKRDDDERTGAYKAIQEKLLPQTVTVTLRAWPGPLFAYDLLQRRPLVAERQGNGLALKVDLGPLGGTLVALYPVQPARVGVTAPADIARGGVYALTVSVTSTDGKPVPGLQPLRVTVTDPGGRDSEFTGYYCAEQGALAVPFAPALNDEAGTWQIVVTDLTAGLSATRTVSVR